MRVTVNDKEIPFVPVTISMSGEEVEALVLWMESIKRNAAIHIHTVANDLYDQLLESKWGKRSTQ